MPEKKIVTASGIGFFHVRAEVAVPGIQIKHHAWITWTEIAIEQEALARRIREMDPMQEYKPALLAITSASFALDALYAVGKELGATDPEADKRWQHVRNVLLAGTLSPHTSKWSPKIHELFRVRDEAVHFGEGFSDPVEHPAISGNVARHMYEWRLEAAESAVNLLLDVLSGLSDQPAPHMAKWAEGMGPTISRLLMYRHGHSLSSDLDPNV